MNNGDDLIPLTIITWSPLIAKGTKKIETLKFPSVKSMQEYACWIIMLRKENFEQHHKMALKKLWDNRDYPKMLAVWKQIIEYTPNDIGMSLEWPE